MGRGRATAQSGDGSRDEVGVQDPERIHGQPRVHSAGPGRESDFSRDIGYPGQSPFTRGRTPNGYRSFEWPHDFYSGYGSSESANERYSDLLNRGATVITLALDLPTQIGYDSDHPMARGEVGKAGVALASLADMDRVLQGIDLTQVGLGFVGNSIGSYVLALTLALAEKRGIDPAFLRHVRIQNDPLKEYTGRDTYIFPVQTAIELATDVVEYICRTFGTSGTGSGSPSTSARHRCAGAA